MHTIIIFFDRINKLLSALMGHKSYKSPSVYSSFSDRVGLLPHKTPFPGMLMTSNGAAFLPSDAIPGVNHMHGMQYQILQSVRNSYTKHYSTATPQGMYKLLF